MAIGEELAREQEFERQRRRNEKKIAKPAPVEDESDIRPVSIFSYGPALSVALLKDLLDLAFIGSIPVIGTIVTFCLSLGIFFLLFLTGSGRRFSLLKKGWLLLGGALTEGIFFGLNFLPLETATVFTIYLLDKRANTPKHKIKREAAKFAA